MIVIFKMIKDNPFFAVCKKLQDIFDKVTNNIKFPWYK